MQPAFFRWERWKAQLALIALGSAFGLLGLIGHLLHVEQLYTLVPGHPPMQPTTSALLCLLAGGLALERMQAGRTWVSLLTRMVGASAFLYGALVCAEYAFSVDLGIDVANLSLSAARPYPGRPSPFTAIGFVSFGLALSLARPDQERSLITRERCLVVALFCSFVSLVGHLLGVGVLYELGGARAVGVALPTSLAFVALGIAGLLQYPSSGWMGLVTSRGPAGMSVRRLGLSAILGTPALVWLLLWIARAGVSDVALLLALGSVLATLLALTLLMITARTLDRVDRVAEANRSRARELFEHAPEGIFLADLEGHYTEVNAAGCRLLGRSREEILATNVFDLIPTEDVSRLRKARERLVQGSVDCSQWRLKRGDGSYVPVEVTANILPNGGWQGFVHDISERLELERKLQESKNFLQNVLESSTEYSIIAENLEQQIVLWNEGARRAWSYESDELAGQQSELLVAPADAKAWAELHRRALSEGSAEGTLLARRKNGSTYSAKIVCTRRLREDGSAEGMLVVGRDLSVEQHYAAEQEFLSRVGVELASCLEYRQTATRVVELITEFFADFAALDMLINGTLERVCMRHADPEGQKLIDSLKAISFPKATPHPIWRVLETKQALLVQELTDEQQRRLASSPEHAAVIERLKPTSIMLVPLIARGQLLAVLTICAAHGSRSYGDAELRLALEVARRAALALDNVQLFQQSRLQGAMTTNLAEGALLIRARDSTIVYANPRLESMFGYAPGELLGKPIHVLNAHHDGVTPEQRAAQVEARLRETGSWHGEIKNVCKNGKVLWCAASISTFDHAEHGQVWIAVHTDISERKQLEENNLRALREKEALLREVHHRVKNNLQVITSLFSLQRERSQNLELRRLLDESRTRVQSIALVHEQLYRSASLAVIDFHTYLERLIAAIGATYRTEGVRIDVHARGVVLDADAAVPCALIVSELVSNSLKHAFAGGPGTVNVRMWQLATGDCTLEVGDDGQGIAASFDWTKAQSLGLRLVQILARQLRGKLELNRQGGTTFRLTFPLHRQHAA